MGSEEINLKGEVVRTRIKKNGSLEILVFLFNILKKRHKMKNQISKEQDKLLMMEKDVILEDILFWTEYQAISIYHPILMECNYQIYCLMQVWAH